MKVYTKGGDAGTTAIGKERVSKKVPRIQAVGDLDELNSVIGLIDAHPNACELTLRRIQNDLMEIGCEIYELARGNAKSVPHHLLNHITDMEREIDRKQEAMPELVNFIIPGGTLLSAYYHMARTVCRRAERSCVVLHESGMISSISIQYLNRLSDFLFVEGRWNNGRGVNDVIWKKRV